MDNCECVYYKGIGYEYYPGVFVENGTKIYDKSTIQGKMQRIVLQYAYAQVLSTTDVEKATEILKSIMYKNSEEYLPFKNNFFFDRDKMIKGLSKNFDIIQNKTTLWFPSNGWVFDTSKKYGIVGSSNKKKKHYRFTVESQYNKIWKNGDKTTCSDCYSFYYNEEITKFFQVKVWFSPEVEILQQKLKLILDYDNVNIVPFPSSKCP
jgi:hypothetical protein